MQRENEIVRLLVREDGFLTYKVLAERLGVSERTIRSDVDRIERRLAAMGAGLQRDRHAGIRLAEGFDARRILDAFGQPAGFSQEGRRSAIMRRLLLEPEELTVKSLAYYVDASRSTVMTDLRACADDLAHDGVILVQVPHRPISLSYGESSYRDAVVRQLRTDSGAVTTRQYEEFLQSLDAGDDRGAFAARFGVAEGLDAAKGLVREYERSEGSKFTDEAFLDVCLYVLVMAQRVREGRSIGENAVRGMAFQPNEATFSHLRTLVDSARHALSLEALDDCELRYLYCYMRAQQSYGRVRSTPTDEDELLEEFLRWVEAYLCVDLEDDPALMRGLRQHIIPAIHRLVFGIHVENPLAAEVRERYPTVFQACRRAGGLFRERFGYELDDDEVSLLALHVAASVEKLYGNQVSSFKKAYVVCAGGVGTSSMLVARLHTTFPNLQVVAVLGTDDLLDADLSQVDCVLSTVQLPDGLPVPVTYVTPLVNDYDIIDIERQVFDRPGRRGGGPLARIEARVADEFDDDVARRVMDIVTSELRPADQGLATGSDQLSLADLLREDYVVMAGDAHDDWRSALRRAGRVLVSHHCVESCYVDAMVAMVEENGPYIVVESGIALAHARSSSGALSTAMSFVVYREPVMFDGCDIPVRIVVGLSVGPVKNHLDAMADLARLAGDRDVVDAWASADSARDFVRFARRGLEAGS